MGGGPGDQSLARIAGLIQAGARLSFEDGVHLYRSGDVHEVGRLANLVRERLHGEAAYYNVNRHINYTNYCVLRCRFCSFYRRHPASDGYELSVGEVVERARQALDAGATEVHIVGGLHPRLPFSYYTEMCAAIRQACPPLHIKAFTAAEIIHLARIARPRLSVRQVLEALSDAGLDSLPGGGAEIFDDRVHDEAFRRKIGEQQWFDVHETAHTMGIPTNATMLYGHVEGIEDRLGHLVKLRDHQDVSLRTRRQAFQCFVPLPFIPEGSALADLPGPTGLDDLKTIAISRLMLDNIPHIKAFWVLQSAKLAQLALSWGADDIDGTVGFYAITTRSAHPDARQREMPVERLQRLILEAGRRPVERDSLYRHVRRAGRRWCIEGEQSDGDA